MLINFVSKNMYACSLPIFDGMHLSLLESRTNKRPKRTALGLQLLPGHNLKRASPFEKGVCAGRALPCLDEPSVNAVHVLKGPLDEVAQCPLWLTRACIDIVRALLRIGRQATP